MSEQATEDGVEISQDGGLDAFGSLMDQLVAAEEPAGDAAAAAAPAEGGDAAAEGGAAGDTPAGGEESAAAAAARDAAANKGGSAASGKPADGAGGDAAVQLDAAGAAAAGAESSRPDTWTAAAADLIEPLGELSNTFEENVTKAYHEETLAKVREEYPKYFEALGKHARELVGIEVPKVTGDGVETLKSAEDAKDWQEGIKAVLAREVHSRTTAVLDENKDFLATIHASIDIFKSNADLIPYTKDFDVELANRFAAMAEPYELRVDEKLQGYSIPVQPLINKIRTELAAERAKAPAKAETPPAAGAAAASKPADPPQAGIQSKAGAGEQKEDFGALFGTLSPELRDFQI